MLIDKTCLTYWLPRLTAAGLPTPRTTLIRMLREALEDLYRLFDGEAPMGIAEPFFAQVREAAAALGYPVFYPPATPPPNTTGKRPAMWPRPRSCRPTWSRLWSSPK
jgi:hypothetical protein